jgi:polyphenol oxidase
MSVSRGDSKKNVSANRQIFLNEFGIDEALLAEPLQVSGDGIEIVEAPGEYASRDALITSQPGVFLRVLTADCSPILIWSSKDSIVAAVHSGWQGSELDILGQTLKKMHSTLGVEIATLSLAIGPGLSQANFEVGPEFSDKFSMEYLLPLPNSDRYLFDNNAYLRDTAIQLGVPANQVEILPFCSFRDDNLFFSHRRDGGTTGRMMSVIGINE